MWKMNEIRRARHVKGHVLYIEFDDGTSGEVDLSGYATRGPVFHPLTDLSFFARFTIEGGTLTWPNGADIAPERLYEMVVETGKPVH